jgi:RHS repeat-associated protein
VQVANQSKILATFDYDFRGLRVGKDITGKPKKIGGFKTRTMLFHYDRQGHFVAENNKAESTLTEYIWLDDMPVAMARNGALYFVHPDHLRTPQKVTDASQNLVWDAVLRPFGRIEQESFTFTQLLRFSGQYHDTEDKLFYNSFRDYDPDLGRYVESDPIGLRGGINQYAYVRDNPLVYIDPSGLWPTLMPGRSNADAQGPGILQKLVPDLTPDEAKQLSQDSLDEFGWNDVANVPDASTTPRPNSLSDLHDNQLEYIEKFLDRLPKKDRAAADKVRKACDDVLHSRHP